MNEKIKFLKIRNVKDPERKFGNAGVDFFIPEYSEQFALDVLACNANKPLLLKDAIEIDENKKPHLVKAIVIPGNCDVKIPAGVKSLIDSDYCLLLVNKSGVPPKKNLIVGSCLVDSSYQGEIHIQLINTSPEPRQIFFGEKMVQGMVINHYADSFTVIDGTADPKAETKFYEGHVSERGARGFGEGTGA